MWEASEQDRKDALQGTKGRLPHRQQVTWSSGGITGSGARTYRVEGGDYVLGQASGEDNNCLINTLSQCVNTECDVSRVRSDLIDLFSIAPGRGLVTGRSFLELDIHGQAVLQAIYRHATAGPVDIDIDRYCIIGVSIHDVGHGGVVVGPRDAEIKCMVVCEDYQHFRPLLPQEVAAQSRSPE